MYDSTTATDIPADVIHVAGYVDGKYAWSASDWARFANARKWGISVLASNDAGNVLDVETGDATPAQAPSWAYMRRFAGVDPIIYCNRSNVPAVIFEFRQTGTTPPKLWIATLDGTQVPLTDGVIACQYAGEAITKRHYDISIVLDDSPMKPGGFTMDDDARRTFAKLGISQSLTAKGIMVTDAELDLIWPSVKLDFSNFQAVLAQAIEKYGGKQV